MSYVMMTEDTENQEQVATNTGWSDFCEWSRTLPAADFFEVRHLAEQGWERDLPDLSDQLSNATEEFPPKVDGVADTVNGIISFIDDHPEAEIIIISNGVELGS